MLKIDGLVSGYGSVQILNGANMKLTKSTDYALRLLIYLAEQSHLVTMKVLSSQLHIPYDNLIPFLHECRRVMKSGGEFSVCVPNFRLYVDAYKDGKLFRNRETWWQPGLIDTGSSIDQLNYIAYMKDEHKYMFDEENLINTLTKCGFSNVQLRDFNEELDLRERDNDSIYAKASK